MNTIKINSESKIRKEDRKIKNLKVSKSIYADKKTVISVSINDVDMKIALKIIKEYLKS